MEPFFDQYISNIQMAGGKVVYVPLHPPIKGATEVCPASDWTLDIEELKAKITDKTRMIVRIPFGDNLNISSADYDEIGFEYPVRTLYCL